MFRLPRYSIVRKRRNQPFCSGAARLAGRTVREESTMRRRRQPVLQIAIDLACAALLLGCPSLAAAQVTEVPAEASITLLATSDLHAHIYPYDYFEGRAAELGLAKVATLVHAARAERPEA